MAIGTLAAIGLGVAGVGAAASASAQKSAANKASQTAADTAAANNALTQRIYDQNAATMAPYIQRGNAAGGAMNALLGLGGGPTNSAAVQAMPTAGTAISNGANDYSNVGGYGWGGITPDVWANWGGMDATGANFGGYLPAVQPTAQTGQAGVGQTAQDAANSAYEIFKNSTNYQGRLKEGANALNSMWAGSGAVKSGAAGKAFERFGQDYASNELMNYMNLLGNQQGVGLGAASAQAGVGQNYVNTVSANNNAAGTAVANAALAKGNNSFGNVLGLIGGGLFGMGR